MDPVRSSLGGGMVATLALTVLLVGADLLVLGSDPFLFATFTGLCAIGGPPYCAISSVTAALLTYLWFILLFGVAWPLLFGGFTWGLPGESGFAHGLVFGLFLWAGYALTTLFDIGILGEVIPHTTTLLVATLASYLAYGIVLGGAYDRLAGRRTFMSDESAA